MIESILPYIDLFNRTRNWFAPTINPKITLPIAPRNTLRHITPAVSIEKVKDLLGSPYYKYSNRMGFLFRSVNIELETDNHQISTIILILKKFGPLKKYPIYPLGYNLGDLTLKQVVDSPTNLRRNVSSKHGETWVERYYGNPGYYRHFTFGIFDGPAVQYPFEFPDFSLENEEWYPEYKNSKINYVGISKEANQGFGFGL